MVDQLARPKDQVEVYWFSEQPQGYIGDAQLEQFDSGRLGFPNTFFDPDKAHLYSITSTTTSMRWPTRWDSTGS